MQPDIKGHAYQHHADEKGHAPAPVQKLLIAEGSRKQRHHAGRKTQARSKAHLRNTGIKGAFALAGIFIGHEHGTAPLAAQSEALHQAEGLENNGSRKADLLVGGHKTDADGGNTHNEHGQHKHALAAQLVAEVTEDKGAERAGQIADGKRAVGQQRADEGVCRGKVELVEEINASFQTDKIEEKDDVKSNKELFYYFKILLFKKRFIFSDILLGVFSAFSSIFLNLLLNISFLDVDVSLTNDKNSLLYSYLAFFLIILFIFVTTKIIFLIFWGKAYLKEVSLLEIRCKKRSELFLFLSLSEFISFIAYIILYFSLFYYFSFEFPLLLNGNFYSLVDYEHYLPLSCFLSFLVLSALFVIFIVISFLFNLLKRKKNLQLEEN